MEELKTEKSNDQNSTIAIKEEVKSNKKLYITIGVALILLIALWIWKSVEISNVEKRAEREKETLKAQMVESHKNHLRLLGKAYVWAVRTEMMNGNINQVNLFANDMIKEKNFQRIAIANDKGIIVSSTNKKDEGQPFSAVGKQEHLSSNNTVVDNFSDNVLTMTSPIMGFNNRLGTLLIRYAMPPATLK